MDVKRRKRWAVAAAAGIVLGAAGCGTGGAAGAEPTGPLTKEGARTDLHGSAASARLPASDPRWDGALADAPADSPSSCGVSYKGYGDKGVKVDLDRFDAVLDELGERHWKTAGKREGRKGIDSRVQLKQRGWTLSAEWRTLPDDSGNGQITLFAWEDDCMAKLKAGGGGTPAG